jgi:hypothetical protein
VSRCPADNPAYRRIVAQVLGVVHVLISSKAAEHRLQQQADQRMAAVPAGSRISECLARHLGQAECVVESRYANNPASDVTTNPRNWSIRRLRPWAPFSHYPVERSQCQVRGATLGLRGLERGCCIHLGKLALASARAVGPAWPARWGGGRCSTRPIG